ncbi:MAG TPA: TfoX/Sxy family protein [Chloroflexota bacterium]|nr:TfoX/Sxy family protein [Chloroflexota bacterium]
MNGWSITSEERFASVVEAFLGDPVVTPPTNGKRFGASGLKVQNRIFAMLVNGRLVVKLPKERIDALVAAGDAERFDPRHDGRVMKEWASVQPTSAEDWLLLAREAREFVAASRSPMTEAR